MTLAEWEQVLSVNLTGQFLCAREAVRHFKQRGVAVHVREFTVAYCIIQDLRMIEFDESCRQTRKNLPQLRTITLALKELENQNACD